MTKDEMVAIAKKKGTVRWVLSGIYEELYLVETPLTYIDEKGKTKQMRLGSDIMARGPVTRPHRLLSREQYMCEEVPRSEPVPVGKVMFPSHRGRYAKRKTMTAI